MQSTCFYNYCYNFWVIFQFPNYNKISPCSSLKEKNEAIDFFYDYVTDNRYTVDSLKQKLIENSLPWSTIRRYMDSEWVEDGVVQDHDTKVFLLL